MTVVKGLVILYGVLTLMAGVLNRVKIGKTMSVLFTLTGLGLVGASVYLNGNVLFIFWMICFIMLHILAIWIGIVVNRRLAYSHHLIRFGFHLFVLFALYHFTK